MSVNPGDLQIARILVAGFLGGERGVAHLTRFRLGPPHGGARRIEVGWKAPRRYTNVEPDTFVIDGLTRF
jgi:hypothetical protein